MVENRGAPAKKTHTHTPFETYALRARLVVVRFILLSLLGEREREWGRRSRIIIWAQCISWMLKIVNRGITNRARIMQSKFNSNNGPNKDLSVPHSILDVILMNGVDLDGIVSVWRWSMHAYIVNMVGNEYNSHSFSLDCSTHLLTLTFFPTTGTSIYTRGQIINSHLSFPMDLLIFPLSLSPTLLCVQYFAFNLLTIFTPLSLWPFYHCFLRIWEKSFLTTSFSCLSLLHLEPNREFINLEQNSVGILETTIAVVLKPQLYPTKRW